MYRSFLIAATITTLGLVASTPCQAQFRIKLGGGHSIGIGSHSRYQPHSNRYQPNKRYVIRGTHHHSAPPPVVHQPTVIQHAKPADLEQPPKPWDGAEHVVRLEHDQFQGAYYEKDGKSYYADEQGTTKLVSHGGFGQVDDLAARLEMMTNELCLDLHHNYRHNTGFRYTYRDVYDVYQLAKYIHDLHEEGSQEEIARRLEGLDRLFHLVRDDVQTWDRRHFRRVGDLDANAKIERIESAIHHLMNDAGVRLAVNPVVAPPPENLVDLPPLPED